MNKRILILGASGAMGLYLVPEMLALGWEVDAVFLGESRWPEHPHLHIIQRDVKDAGFLIELLKNRYNAIVDFMIYYSEEEFGQYYKLFLENTDHYFFLSTYRIYAEDVPLTEESPRLLDVTEDEVFLSSGDYAIYKAQEENMIRESRYHNWTILRPAITYSLGRYQLTTLEANVLVYRMLQGKTVMLPKEAMDKQATMSWAGDVAKMISKLVLNEKAYGETFTVSTSEHHTWREIAEIYKEIAGLSYVEVDTEAYLSVWGNGDIRARQQLVYDRLFDRVVDNRKVLSVTGMKQEDLMPLKEGLAMELARLKPETILSQAPGKTNERMDVYLASTACKGEL